jgi:hypothetical protein
LYPRWTACASPIRTAKRTSASAAARAMGEL